MGAQSNGTQGVIEQIRMTAKGYAVLAIRLEGSGRLVKLDTATYGELDYAYARTVDRAQGRRCLRLIIGCRLSG